MSGTVSVMNTLPGASKAGIVRVKTPSALDVAVIVLVLTRPLLAVMSSFA